MLVKERRKDELETKGVKKLAGKRKEEKEAESEKSERGNENNVERKEKVF